eukprot:2926765-Pleurochrysis_carterae.AAC.2
MEIESRIQTDGQCIQRGGKICLMKRERHPRKVRLVETGWARTWQMYDRAGKRESICVCVCVCACVTMSIRAYLFVRASSYVHTCMCVCVLWRRAAGARAPPTEALVPSVHTIIGVIAALVKRVGHLTAACSSV